MPPLSTTDQPAALRSPPRVANRARRHTRAALGLGLALALAATSPGCKRGADKETPCRAVVDHTIDLLSGAAAEQATSDRMQLIKTCEATGESQRQCALSAQSVLDLGKCAARPGARAAGPTKASANKRAKKRARGKARSKQKQKKKKKKRGNGG